MTPLFTPGPWTVDECPGSLGHWTIREADGTPNGDTDAYPIATVYTQPTGGEGEANAKLVATAPTMFAAIETALRHHTENAIGRDTWAILQQAFDDAGGTVG